MSRFRGLSLITCFAALILGCSSPEAPPQAESSADSQPGPDYIFINGNVLTVDNDFSIVEAVAVTGNKITAVGSTANISGLAAANTEIIDLNGKTMTPGLIDNHNHLIYSATIWPNVVRLGNIRSRAKALEAIAAKAKELGPGDGAAYTVFAFGGFKSLQFLDQPGDFTREELDAVAPDNPVIAGGWSSAYSSATVNTKALDYTGITRETQGPADPGDGVIVRDENGDPTGQFLGSVFIKWTLRSLFTEVTGPNVIAGLKMEIDDYLALGVTTSQTYNSPELPESLFAYLQENFADTPEQKMRIFYPPQWGNAETATNPSEVAAVVERLSTRAPFQGTDMFQETHFGEHVYRPIPGNDGNVSEEDWAIYKEICIAAAKGGWQVTEHAHRNSIMAREVEIYEEINEEYPITDLRWRIDHATTLSPDLLERMEALGMLIAIQSHIAITSPESRDSLEWWREAIEVRDTPPLAAIRESGILYGFGSDGQTAGQDSPFFSMWWLVSGKDTTEQPYFTRGTLSREEALIGYTRSNAYLMFKEDKLGTIEVGKLADLVVLDRDYMTVPEDDIRDLKSVLTMVDGRIVYEADAPDQVLSNGKILTVDEEFSIVEAIAIDGDRILATGSNEEMLALAGVSTDVVDLEGRTVVPGLIDNHVHFIRTVQRWHQQARIDGVESREEALAIVADHAESLPPGEWFMVQGGWSEDQFSDQKGGFSLEELDRVSPNNPVYLQRSYGAAYANSLALNAVEMPTENGSMIRGRGSYNQMFRLLPAPSEQQLHDNLYQFSADLAAVGLTTAYDVDRPSAGDIGLIAEASAEQPLPIRVFHTLKFRAMNSEEADAAVELLRNNTPFSVDDRIGLLGLGEHVYGPMHDSSNTVESYPEDIWTEYMKLAAAAAEEGWHIHEHTMADKTVIDFMDRLDILNETTPITDLRWSLAHVLTLSDETIERARDLGLTMAVHGQAMHQSRPIVPRGDATRPPIPPIKAMEDSGIVWGLGTDTGVVSHYQPFVTIMWAATGLGIDGTQIHPQPVGREAALVAHTRSNAYLMFKEDDLGSLEAGKLADLVVLDRDYLTVPAHEIKDITPVMTMVGGDVVYSVDAAD